MAGPHLDESTVTTPSITGGVVVNTASLSLSRPTNYDSSICTIDDFISHLKHKDLENDVSKYLSHKQRPLCRRVLSYLRTAWMGAKFTSKTGIYLMARRPSTVHNNILSSHPPPLFSLDARDSGQILSTAKQAAEKGRPG